MSIWVLLDEDMRAVSEWRVSGDSCPLTVKDGDKTAPAPGLMNVSGFEGPFLGRVYDPLTKRFGGPPYEVALKADRTRIASDGAEEARILLRAEAGSGALEDVTAPIKLLVDGRAVEVDLIDGAGELIVSAASPGTIRIGLAPSPTFRLKGARVVLEAAPNAERVILRGNARAAAGASHR
ncbi:MAG: hypothetical protein ABIG68_05215 [Acidobacteriota bacterium]